mgnify:CR=1 FL=1
MDNLDYQQKYLKYKKKYLDLKKIQLSGASNNTEIIYSKFPLPTAILRFKDSGNKIAKLTLDWGYEGGIYFTIYNNNGYQTDAFVLIRGPDWKSNIHEIRRLSEMPENVVTNFKRLSFEISNDYASFSGIGNKKKVVNKLKEITDNFVS